MSAKYSYYQYVIKKNFEKYKNAHPNEKMNASQATQIMQDSARTYNEIKKNESHPDHEKMKAWTATKKEWTKTSKGVDSLLKNVSKRIKKNKYQ